MAVMRCLIPARLRPMRRRLSPLDSQSDSFAVNAAHSPRALLLSLWMPDRTPRSDTASSWMPHSPRTKRESAMPHDNRHRVDSSALFPRRSPYHTDPVSCPHEPRLTNDPKLCTPRLITDQSGEQSVTISLRFR